MRTSVAIAFLCIVLAPFGLLCTAWTFIFLSRGEYFSAVVALGFAIFSLGLILMMAVIASRTVKPRIQREDDGIMVRPDRRVDNLLMASTFGAFLGMACYAVFAPLDMIAIRVPRNDVRYFVLGCAAATLVGVFSVLQIIRRRGTSYVRMTLDGLELGNTVNSAERTWDEVTDIADRAQTARRASGTTYITTADGRTRVVPTDWYTPGGHALRELVRVYWKHPEDREELVDGRALRRLETES